jgi:hypothetical protein
LTEDSGRIIDIAFSQDRSFPSAIEGSLNGKVSLKEPRLKPYEKFAVLIERNPFIGDLIQITPYVV